MAKSLLFTNHLHVLTALVGDPDLRIREVAARVGITERAAHRIISELVAEGYLSRIRVGPRNRYERGERAEQLLLRDTEGLGPQGPGLLAPERGAVLTLESPPSAGSTAPGVSVVSAAFATAPVGIVVADDEGRCLASNAAFCALVERDPSELVGRQMRDFTHPDDLYADELAALRVQSGSPEEYVREKRLLTASGTERWVEVKAIALAHPDTGEQLYVATYVDISDRKRQSVTLAEAERRFGNAFSHAPIGMSLVSPSRQWLKVNRALCELTGYSETELLLRSARDLTHPDDVDLDTELIEGLLAGRRENYQIEKRYLHARGHVIWALVSVSLIRNESGAPLYFLSQIQDITEQKTRPRGGRR